MRTMFKKIWDYLLWPFGYILERDRASMVGRCEDCGRYGQLRRTVDPMGGPACAMWKNVCTNWKECKK